MKTNKRKTNKRKTNKRKTNKRKTNKNIIIKIGGGKFVRKNTPCRYGEECTNENPIHIKGFTHPCPYGATCTRKNPIHIKEFHIKQFTRNNAFTDNKPVLDYLEKAFNTFNERKPLISEIEMLRDEKNTLDAVDQANDSLYFKILSYIDCNLCDLIKKYGVHFIDILLHRMEEEAIGGLYRNKCINGDEHEVSNTYILQKLRDPDVC
jgi:hypothetical protein